MRLLQRLSRRARNAEPSRATSVETAPQSGVLNMLASAPACAPLQTHAEMLAANALVEMCGLPSHHDSQKNWDSIKSLLYILRAGDPRSPVLDAGSGGRSAILRWLKLLGYKRLYACDLVDKKNTFYQRLGIEFSVQDLTRTNYRSGFFQAVSSISVIEHNVPLDRFAAEMSRILRPGGLLLVSTDYWSEPIDCAGIFPYGEEAGEMKIFTPDGIREFDALARRSGFSLCAPLELSTNERCVRWERVDRRYTFAFLAFRKIGD